MYFMRFSVLETTVDVSAMIGRICDMKIERFLFLTNNSGSQRQSTQKLQFLKMKSIPVDREIDDDSNPEMDESDDTLKSR